VIAEQCGVTADEIDQVRIGPTHPGWEAFDAALLAAVDELHDTGRVADGTWTTLAARYSTEQMLDLLFTVGNYHLVSFVLNSCGVQLDAGIADAL
jgi:hypothetical protein